MALFKIEAKKIVTQLFLVCIAILPFLSLYWQTSLPYIGFKINWLLYPVVILGIIAYIVLRSKAPRPFVYLLAFAAFYWTIILIRGRDSEGLVRFCFSLVPLAFLDFFNGKTRTINLRSFWLIYAVAFTIPMYYAFLQYTGRMPYYDFDVVDGQYVGRISAGYSKPNNFVAYLFPVYMLGFYLALIKKRWLTGGVIILSLCSLLLIIGHRTSLLAFLTILGAAFFMRLFAQTIYTYYKYYGHLFAGIIVFGCLFAFQYVFGIIDAFRGRLAMWEAHAEDFFTSNIFDILFGKQQILLSSKYERIKLVGSAVEVHNNTFRTIVFFGIIGYLLYCVFIRWVVMTVYEVDANKEVRFIKVSCFAFLIFYCTTNEPYYYSSILWPVLVWVFLLGKSKSES